MTILFNPIDLKDEYKDLYLRYKNLYLQKHPDATDDRCSTYAIRRVRKKARELYDYKQILLKIESNADVNQILRLHKSCAERQDSLIYYDYLNEFLFTSKCILDIGCGLNPCMVLSQFDNISQYYCYDNDSNIMELLELMNRIYFKNKLTLISNSSWEENEMISNINPDVLLVQKLISNLYYSRNIKMTDRISNINAKYYFVSGCLWSLSRNVSIKEKERCALEWFIRHYNFQKIKYIETASEFGWILVKPTDNEDLT